MSAFSESRAMKDLMHVWEPLLQDPDVFAFSYCGTGEMVITRGTHLERLQVSLDDELVRTLKDACEDGKPVELRLTPSSILSIRRDEKGDLITYLQKETFDLIPLPRLIQQGFMSQTDALTLLHSIQNGSDLAIVGPHQIGRRILLQALAHEAGSFCRPHLVAPDRLSGASPLENMEMFEEETQRASSFGATLLICPEMDVCTYASVADQYPELPLLVSLRSPTVLSVQARLKEHQERIAFALVGALPQGAPCLVRPTGQTNGGYTQPAVLRGEDTTAPVNTGTQPSTTPAPPVLVPAPEPIVSQTEIPNMPDALHQELPPLRPLPPGPPEGWGSESPADPGWELDSGFSEVLESVANRPKFHPNPPPMHPQAQTLKEKPFGGISLEPPPEFSSGGGETAAQNDSSEEPL